MDYRSVHDRIVAAQIVLNESATSVEKFSSVRSLLKGINPKLDALLGSAHTELSKLEKIHKGEIMELAVESLSADTEKDKKRKKALLAFLKFWKELKSEVDRVHAELESHATSDHALHTKAVTAGKIISGAKGPLGLVTAVAIGVVVLQSIAVRIVIKNIGCDPIIPFVQVPVPIPGISLPKKVIPDGGSGVAMLPPLTVTVDGTQKGIIRLQVVGYSMTFDLRGDQIDVAFDGMPLFGKQTIVHLGQSKQHELVVRCR